MNLKIETQDFENEILENGGIYALWNNESNKVYIGQTAMSFCYRWSWHEALLKSNSDSRYLQHSFNKHGSSSFLWCIIEKIPENLYELWKRKDIKSRDKKELIKWLDIHEKYWIAYYRNILGEKNVFNIQDGGTNGTRKYHPHTNKERYNMSKAGKKRFSNPEERRKQSKRIKSYFNKFKKERPKEFKEYCKQISIRLKESYKNNPQRSINVSNGLKKSYQKPGRLEKTSQIQLIVQGKQEVRDKKSKSMTGIKWTDEALENRAKGIHESNKQKHQELDAVLWLAEQVNPHIKYQSRIFKKCIISKIIEELRWLKYTSLTYENVYDILKRCNLLKHRFRSDEFDGSIDFNTYFVIEQYT